MPNRTLNVIILAAGKGTRMVSTLPKVLHPLGGKPIIQHIIDTVIQLNNTRIHLIYGHGGTLLREYVSTRYPSSINWVMQMQQNGTGHAVQQILPYLNNNEDALVIYGDVPLIALNTLQKLLASKPEKGIGILTSITNNPTGYGRIVRVNDQVTEVIEPKNLQKEQECIKEINVGVLVTSCDNLKRWCHQLNKDKKNSEYYLTSIINKAYNEDCTIKTIQPERSIEAIGVNNRLQLAYLERLFQKEQANLLLLGGVMLSDPNCFNLRGELNYGKDLYIDTNVILEGHVVVGDNVVIGTGCFLKNVTIGDNVVISPYSVIEGTHVSQHSTIGPFVHLRSGCELKENTHVGNFVEIKNTVLGKGSKAGHLSYLGDAEIGEHVNIGAGAITCNYDGNNKNKTIIEDNVLIGSGSQLVAPITIGYGATVGAGTTITHNVQNGETIINKLSQSSITHCRNSMKKSSNKSSEVK